MRKGIEIFRAGKQTTSSGESLNFTEAALDATIAAYDPALHEAPLVVGHPKTDAPAYGWVRGLFLRDGDVLAAEPHQVDAAFAELVTDGKFKKISASFYKPDSDRNPVPGVYYLRHVGFLGAAAPAVRGLKDASFDAPAEDVVSFEAPMSLMAERDNASLWRSLRDWILARFGVEEADTAVPAWYVEQLREEQARREAATPNPSFAEGDAPTADPASSSEPAAADPAASAEPDASTAAEPDASAVAPSAEPASSTDPEPAAAAPEPAAVDPAAAELDRRRAELEQREAAFRERESQSRRRDVTEFVDGLTADGCRILPRDRAALVELLFAADESAELEFAEEDGTQVKTATGAWLRDFLARLPRQVEFAEFAAPGRDPDATDPVALADAARAYQAEQEAAGKHVRISDAVRHVAGGRR